jgi:endonuclease YncB( thermonuclease family)
MKNLALLVLFALLTTLPAFAKEPIRILEGTVVKVADGDTCTVNSGGTKIRIRLYGIDAPETEKRNKRTDRISKLGQSYGKETYQALEKKISGQRVQLEIMDIDRYRRMVAIIRLGNREINREMVAEGFAWAYRQYLDRPYASEYIGLEDAARKQRLGLWSQSNPEPPWEFRKRQRMR